MVPLKKSGEKIHHGNRKIWLVKCLIFCCSNLWMWLLRNYWLWQRKLKLLQSGASKELCIFWTEKMINAYIKYIIGKKTWLSEMNRCKCMCFGHIRSRDRNNLENVIMEWIVTSHHNWEKLQRRWIDGME